VRVDDWAGEARTSGDHSTRTPCPAKIYIGGLNGQPGGQLHREVTRSGAVPGHNVGRPTAKRYSSPRFNCFGRYAPFLETEKKSKTRGLRLSKRKPVVRS
jgi:hypothetical protein